MKPFGKPFRSWANWKVANWAENCAADQGNETFKKNKLQWCAIRLNRWFTNIDLEDETERARYSRFRELIPGLQNKIARERFKGRAIAIFRFDTCVHFRDIIVHVPDRRGNGELMRDKEARIVRRTCAYLSISNEGWIYHACVFRDDNLLRERKRERGEGLSERKKKRKRKSSLCKPSIASYSIRRACRSGWLILYKLGGGRAHRQLVAKLRWV
jgi:hypothetical protein